MSAVVILIISIITYNKMKNKVMDMYHLVVVPLRCPSVWSLFAGQCYNQQVSLACSIIIYWTHLSSLVCKPLPDISWKLGPLVWHLHSQMQSAPACIKQVPSSNTCFKRDLCCPSYAPCPARVRSLHEVRMSFASLFSCP